MFFCKIYKSFSFIFIKVVIDGKQKYINRLPLQSSYVLDGQTQLLKYTNYTYFFQDILDYIFYDANILRPISVLGDIDYEWFTENQQVGMPNPYFPSDHIPLLTEFEWINMMRM